MRFHPASLPQSRQHKGKYDAMIAAVAREGHDCVQLFDDEGKPLMIHGKRTGPYHAITTRCRRLGLPYRCVVRNRELYLVREP
jgi:hypothetical protein